MREGKVPPDKRVPLTPKQCVQLMNAYPGLKIYVQSSTIRAIEDEAYSDLEIPVVQDVSHCDVLMGVKEVNIADLLPNKKYFFFSHTFKKQPYNKALLQAVLNKNIQLIDYELLKDKNHARLIGFGRYAGIVGCYNGFRTFGLKHDLYELKPANQCFDRKEMEAELVKVKLPNNFKLILTGFGRVGHGAREILALLPIQEVEKKDFIAKQYSEPVFCQIEADDYNKRKDGKSFTKSDFYEHAAEFESAFFQYAQVADMYIACHFWSNKAPYILTQENLQNPACKLSVVADISCDIAEPIACTIRPSTIAEPIYGYDPKTGKEVDFKNENAIAVMAVDNLPCELPKDASHDFGENLVEYILPHFFGEDEDKIIERASETNLNGELMPDFKYLQDFVGNSDAVEQ